jgi:hypothetical protein
MSSSKMQLAIERKLAKLANHIVAANLAKMKMYVGVARNRLIALADRRTAKPL